VNSIDARYEKIDATLERVNAIFGDNPRSRDYGYDCRNLLGLADYHAKRFSYRMADSILSLLGEMLDRWEVEEKERVEFDAWCTKQEAEYMQGMES
jgi:hypothetical protein